MEKTLFKTKNSKLTIETTKPKLKDIMAWVLVIGLIAWWLNNK
ncbi:hypothetical protein [Companilactobacillus zhachilii]|jgi:hypothetical protein|nr:hypothetical protein [Companilactobacillus zhachilii]